MANISIELPPEVYEKLKETAQDLGKSPQELAQELVISQLNLPEPEPLSERERGLQALRAAGLLTELGPLLLERANQSTITHEEAQQILSRAGGKPLSEIVIEQRGSLDNDQPLRKRESLTKIIAEAGLLSELGPELKARAASSTGSLAEVREWLTPGQPLSEIVMEQRK